MVPSALVVLVLASSWASPYPEKVGPPASMTGLGDSITRGTNTSFQRLGDHPELSWSTGTDGGVVSHHTQLDELGAAPQTFNHAVNGARMQGIGGQVTNAIASGAGYVTILMGGNDACRGSVDVMTDPAVYRQQFEDAMEALTAGLPDSRIFVASVPDLYVLWEVLHTNASAVQTWDGANICQSLLANPGSTDAADVARREAVRERVLAYNAILEEVCNQYLHCRYDQNAVFDVKFAAADVSTADYFHPSLAGQSRLGAETWPATFDFTDLTAPVTTATVTLSSAEALLELTATDPEGVRGIEYRTEGDTRWTRYQDALTVPADSFVFFRAVDVNGNTEAAQRYPPGTEPDAGSIDPDDGGTAQPEDGGAEPIDGGVDPPDSPTGCGCGANGGIPIAALAFAVAALLSRRRR